MNFQQTVFLQSAAKLSQLPKDIGIEIAFMGRSNAGKSSAINTITGIKHLARTSKTPGRTQLINLFEIEPDKRLADLPGYGFAKVPASVKKQWEQTINHYLAQRKSLKALILIMDSRHPLQATDWELIHWSDQIKLPLHILLTKCDKLTAAESRKTLASLHSQLKPYPLVTVQLFSAIDKTGCSQARKKVEDFLF